MSDAEETGQEAVKFINDLQDISFVTIAMIVGGAWVAIYVVMKALPFLAERGPSQLRLYFLAFVPLIRLVIIVVAVLWVVPIIFNVTFQNFLVLAGAISVGVGFAFKDYLASLIAGIVAIFERPYRAGDWVEIDGDYGEVRSVGMRALQLITADDNVITVPHDRIWTNNISNANDGARTLMCIAEFYLTPGHDAQAIRAALQDVALTSAYLEYAKPVTVMLTQTPYGTHYKLKAYPFEMRDQFAFISDMVVRGKRAIARVGGSETTADFASSQPLG